jgi:hypothetical protein
MISVSHVLYDRSALVASVIDSICFIRSPHRQLNTVIYYNIVLHLATFYITNYALSIN